MIGLGMHPLVISVTNRVMSGCDTISFILYDVYKFDNAVTVTFTLDLDLSELHAISVRTVAT